VDVLQNEMFLGMTGNRTIFQVATNTAVDISKYSAYPSENELILLPGIFLVVEGVIELGANLHIVQLQEQPSTGLLDFVRPPKTAPSDTKSAPKSAKSTKRKYIPDSPPHPGVKTGSFTMTDFYPEIQNKILDAVECTITEVCSLCLVSKLWRRILRALHHKWPFLIGSKTLSANVLSYVWTNEFILDIPLYQDCHIISICMVLKHGTTTDKSKYAIGTFQPAQRIGDKYKCALVSKQYIPNIKLPQGNFLTQTILVDPPLKAKRGQLVGMLYETALPFLATEMFYFPHWPQPLSTPCNTGSNMNMFIDNEEGTVTRRGITSSAWNVRCEAIFPEDNQWNNSKK